VTVREVTKDQSTLVQEILLEYKKTVCSGSTHLVSPEIVTGISHEVLERVTEHLPYITSCLYVKEKMNILNKQTIQELLLIVNDIFGDLAIENDEIMTEVRPDDKNENYVFSDDSFPDFNENELETDSDEID